ncbi:LysE family translocator [Nocardia sp. NPDC004604]|uniref:LysE family translocator n=1 Tax=Nocardia sp. NPDC004604 TaxID=3157013 RepID=UPI0033ACBC9D
MMSTAQVLALGGVMLVGSMSPGPDFVIVTRNAAVSGRRVGVASAVGIALGVFVWSMVTAVGVAGVLAASAVTFTVLKLIGAGYLAVLGLRALLAARRGDYPVEMPELKSHGTVHAFRQGLLCNLLNPKVAVFFIALLPQFLPAEPSTLDTLESGIVTATVCLAWFSLLAVGVGALRHVLDRRSVRRAIDATMGTFMVALGIRIAVQSN